MTPRQVELLAFHASGRVRGDMMQRANVVAIGTATGFTGNDKPLKELNRQLGLGGTARNKRHGLEEFVQALTGAGRVKVESEGARADNGRLDGRRASRRTRR